jgi:hypothetical protein
MLTRCSCCAGNRDVAPLLQALRENKNHSVHTIDLRNNGKITQMTVQSVQKFGPIVHSEGTHQIDEEVGNAAPCVIVVLS